MKISKLLTIASMSSFLLIKRKQKENDARRKTKRNVMYEKCIKEDQNTLKVVCAGTSPCVLVSKKKFTVERSWTILCFSSFKNSVLKYQKILLQ